MMKLMMKWEPLCHHRIIQQQNWVLRNLSSGLSIYSSPLMLRSYLQYIGLVKYAKATGTLLQLQEINLPWCQSRIGQPCFHPNLTITSYSHPLPTLSCECTTLHVQHTILDYVSKRNTQQNIHQSNTVCTMCKIISKIHHVYMRFRVGVCNAPPLFGHWVCYSISRRCMHGGHLLVWLMPLRHWACEACVYFCSSIFVSFIIDYFPK
jgi:hypothetical protein